MTQEDFEEQWQIYEEECFFNSLHSVLTEQSDIDPESDEFEDE